MIEVRLLPFREIYLEPNFIKLIEEYTQESEMPEMAPIEIDVELYCQMNEAGSLYVIGAFKEQKLIGFGTFMIAPNLHYSKRMAVTESFFVAEEFRKSGAGVLLLQTMESLAKDMGATCFFVSAPSDSKLCKVMNKHKGYRETNRIFLKSLT